MTVNRTPELLAAIREWAEEFTAGVEQGMRSMRAQWDIEGHAEPLTLYANKSGTFIIEPGQKPAPVKEWLGS
jgi:hypothetical protein